MRWPDRRRLGAALLLAPLLALAAPPPAQPLARVGTCPSGYAVSGGYCKPGPQARYAVEKVGSCAAGYAPSGAYCLAGPNARLALPRSGSCPSGFAVSGAYCLGTK